MDFTQILSFIDPTLVVIVVACYVLGMFIKGIPSIKNWLIPLILLGFAIIVTILYLAIVLGQGFTGKVFILGLIQGLICSAVAVYGNEVVKQLINKGTDTSVK